MKPYFQQLIQHLSLFDSSLVHEIEQYTIVEFVNGCHMACPMPLLKTKVALRKIEHDNQAVYTIATDANSQNDIQAFCRQSGYQLIVNTKITQNSGTIFHFIITKIHSKP